MNILFFLPLNMKIFEEDLNLHENMYVNLINLDSNYMLHSLIEYGCKHSCKHA